MSAIPGGTKGTLVFGCMIANSALLLLARSASAALLILANPQLFLAYMLGDVGIMYIQKAARNDLRYMDDFGLLGDILLPLFTKLIADYTGLLQLRGPGVLGGAYFSFNQVRDGVPDRFTQLRPLSLLSQVLAILAPLVATKIFFSSGDSTVGEIAEAAGWLPTRP